MDKVSIFSLKPGQKFVLLMVEYQLREYKIARRPRLGRVPHAICVDKNGKVCKFLSNWEVEVEDISKEVR